MNQSTPSQPTPDNSDIPPRFLRYGLETFPKSLQKEIQSFIEDPSCWCLYLHGETGSRKTTLAAAALVKMREKAGAGPARLGMFIPGYRAATVIRNVDSPGTKDFIANLNKTPVLLFDDLGKHRDTPHLTEQILFILHYRYDWNMTDGGRARKTILTSNLTLQQLAETIDPATARRIEEGMVIHLEVPK